MQRVRHFYRELAAGRLLMAFQPVVALPDFGQVLYHEALLRHSSVIRQPFAPFSRLEKQGMMLRLDLSVMSTVIQRLRLHPGLSLGCNISAQSAILVEDWQPVLQQLAAEPEVACRLVIEITESAATPNITRAVDFVNTMRASGCRIAVDDFGSGYSTLEFILQSSPDIIKIDKGYMERARINPLGRTTLSHLLPLCKSLAPCVIVEGIETHADSEMVNDLGGNWGQGYLLGRPSLQALGSPCKVLAPRQPSMSRHWPPQHEAPVLNNG
ncbi:EAL domain-containing protein [Pseudomonas cichorii]|uniref:EAL domain-containing protein n=1 Tax=Pseudomonas cichorii TaxID=36746 RepID=UPI000EFF5962|nr:EAL domain-containing protein [Pseudomonas cichorii]